MAKPKNYDAKIEALNAKIALKAEQLKKLKDQLSSLEAEKAKNDYKALLDFMVANNITVEDVMAKLKE